MKFTATLLSIVMFMQLVLFPTPTYADVKASEGGPSGQASVNKIGKLLLAEGIATLTATSIEIASKDSSGNQQTQLKGKLFNKEQAGSTLKGLAFFNSGPLLSKLDAANCNDFVKKIDGNKVSGPVTDVTESSVTCAGQTIPIGEVSQIHSARVFKYSTKVGESPKVKLSATCKKVKGSMTMGKKILFTALVVGVIAGIACAIAIPIAVASSGGGGSPPPFIPAPAPRPSEPAPMPSGP